MHSTIDPTLAQPGPILLVTQQQANAQMMQQVLSDHGLSCLHVPNLDGVTEAILGNSAGLAVLTEAALGTAPNFQDFLESLDQQPPWSDVPIIFLLKDCQQFLHCGALLRQDVYRRNIILLELPLKQQEFLSVVQTALHSRQRQFELRNTLRQLQESNQTLESFGHTVSHELRNPLGIITTSLDLLTRSELDPKQQKLAQMGLGTARKMNQTLSILLDFGKLNARELIEFGWVDMGHVVEQSIESLQALIDNRPVHIHQQNLPTVWGNGELLVRLLTNLIRNAIVHHGAGDILITITAEEQPEHYQFQVMDNGPGIVPEEQTQIFAMFTRSKHAGADGRGIGLALCRRIVEQHQGNLGVRSELGQGSTFYFDLPKDRT
jgi:signal transduction histidine kinase